VAQLSGAPHISCAKKLGKVPHPPLEDERRPLPTQGEAIQEEAIQGEAIERGAIKESWQIPSSLIVLTGAQRRILSSCRQTGSPKPCAGGDAGGFGFLILILPFFFLRLRRWLEHEALPFFEETQAAQVWHSVEVDFAFQVIGFVLDYARVEI
jgi:hypothetical protein